jgi:hypothetical protein
MDEMTLLRELGEEIDTTTGAGAPAPRTRHRVVTGIAAGGRGRRRTPHLLPRHAVPVGAALLAGGMAVAGVQVLGDDAPGPAAPPVARGEAGATLDARTILLAAARTARGTDVPVPDPRSFVYTRTKERGMGGEATGDGGIDWERFATTREAWLSVDGSRDGAVTPSGSTDLVAIPAGELAEPAYGGHLPRTAKGMREYLYRRAADDDVAFADAVGLAQETLLPAATRAALFEAMATIPGVEVVPDARNIDGERGVAIARAGTHIRDELIFSRDGHRVIGQRTVVASDAGDHPAGTVLYTTAVLEVAVVDQVRERPDGTFREGPIQGTGKEGKPAPTKG